MKHAGQSRSMLNMQKRKKGKRNFRLNKGGRLWLGLNPEVNKSRAQKKETAARGRDRIWFRKNTKQSGTTSK
jgi:hypothetical protein